MISIWPWPLISRSNYLLNYGISGSGSQLFLSFDLGLYPVVCRCITMRRSAAYHHDFHLTLTFDFKVKLPPKLWYFCVWATTFLSFDLGLYPLVCRCITMRQCIVYHYDLYLTLTFNFKVKIPLKLWYIRVKALPFLSFDLGLYLSVCKVVSAWGGMSHIIITFIWP